MFKGSQRRAAKELLKIKVFLKIVQQVLGAAKNCTSVLWEHTTIRFYMGPLRVLTAEQPRNSQEFSSLETSEPLQGPTLFKRPPAVLTRVPKVLSFQEEVYLEPFYRVYLDTLRGTFRASFFIDPSLFQWFFSWGVWIIEARLPKEVLVWSYLH